MKVAYIENIYTYYGRIEIKVRCPYCGSRHRHGGGTTQKPLDMKNMTKISHCRAPSEEIRVYKIEKMI